MRKWIIFCFALLFLLTGCLDFFNEGSWDSGIYDINAEFNAQSASVGLSWEAGNDAFYYKVYRESDGEFQFLEETVDTFFRDYQAQPDVPYHYYVTAVNFDLIESSPSPVVVGSTVPVYVNESLYESVETEEYVQFVWYKLKISEGSTCDVSWSDYSDDFYYYDSEVYVTVYNEERDTVLMEGSYSPFYLNSYSGYIYIKIEIKERYAPYPGYYPTNFYINICSSNYPT